MSCKIINRRDLDFLLYQILDVCALSRYERFNDHDRETFDAAIDTAYRIATDYFAPHNRKADEHEPQLDSGTVTIIPEVKEALSVAAEAGLMAATEDYELGGMQLPFTVAQACFAMLDGANAATQSYGMLTSAAARLIKAHGSEEQRSRYLEPMLTGRFFGTMALTEPQAGSSLADIKTTAVPTAEGHYLLTGSKIFISGGDHELSENIVHMVLARIKGAPPGTRGISMFIVPKILVNADGSLERRNDVVLAGLIHKMGWRGTVSTMLNFGEREQCVGYLVGEPHKGLSYMFQMMNEARIGVGLMATMLGYTGYLHALEYARERPQGRRLAAKQTPDSQPQVAIVEHSDVKRMLLAQKAYVEGALGLCLYAARLSDEQHFADADTTRREAGLLLDLLTPIVKAWPSHYCLEANSLAIQVHGGYGYTREYPVEQFYRDNRLNPIHEGTNGIQALDLLGRKAAAHNGAALELLRREVGRTVTAAADSDSAAIRAYGEALDDALQQATATTHALLRAAGEGKVELALANAALYLDMLGHTVIAWIWLRQALEATAELPHAQGSEADFYRGKLQACRYFFHWELPKTRHQHKLLRRLDATCMDMRSDWF